MTIIFICCYFFGYIKLNQCLLSYSLFCPVSNSATKQNQPVLKHNSPSEFPIMLFRHNAQSSHSLNKADITTVFIRFHIVIKMYDMPSEVSPVTILASCIWVAIKVLMSFIASSSILSLVKTFHCIIGNHLLF